MLMTLTKKQFYEAFRTYYINSKTGKSRTKGGIIAMYALFTFLMLFLVAVFFGMSAALGHLMMGTEYEWLMYTIMGMVSIGLGTFGSVFNTYSALYQSKDNDMLLAMPIKPSTILLSRMSLVYGMSLLYSGAVWIPTIVSGCIFGKPTALSILCLILLTFVIALLVTVLTCALGWVVALITSRLSNRSILVTVLSVLFLGAYFYVCFNLENFLESVTINSASIGTSLHSWADLFCRMGMAATGDPGNMLLFTGVTVTLFALCLLILSRTFMSIVRRQETSAPVSATKRAEKAHSYRGALLLRELRRFTSSSTYMLNCGLGLVLLPVGAAFALIRQNELNTALVMLRMIAPELVGLLPWCVMLMVCMVVSLNAISTPSVSLEGKHLWLLQSLPVDGGDVLRAKRDLHIVLNILPALLSNIVLMLVLKANMVIVVISTLYVLLFISFTGSAGLMIGLLRPNLNWTSETKVIKQSVNVLFVWLAGLAVLAVTGAAGYFLRNVLPVMMTVAVCAAALAGGTCWISQWLKKDGARIFASL